MMMIMGAIVAVRPAIAATPVALSLDMAVRRALQNNATLNITREAVISQAGFLREVGGEFDPLASGSLTLSTGRRALTVSERGRLDGQRDLFRTLSTNLQAVADDLQNSLDTSPGERVTIPCSSAGGVLSPGTEIDLIDAATGQVIIVKCTTSAEATTTNGTQLLLDALIASTTDPDRLAQLNLMRANGIQLSRQNIANIIAALNTNARDLRDSLRKLGPSPLYDQTTTLTLDTSYKIPFRNGMSITPRFLFQTFDSNYVGKPRNPQFGGKGLLNTFTSAAGFEFFAPLRRGRGRASADANEIAARLRWNAGRLDLEQTAAQTIFQAADAYLLLIFAQDRVALLEESTKRFQTILEEARALVSGDNIARADLGYVRARLAATDSQASTARAQVVQQRATLMRTMGEPAEDLSQSPAAIDKLPSAGEIEQSSTPDPARATTAAMLRRTDIAASALRVDASRVIAEKARLDLQPRLDLTLFVGYSGFIDTISYGRGFRGALFGSWHGPSVGVLLDWEMPWGNRAAAGRREQAIALETIASTTQGEVARLTGTQISSLAAALDQAKLDVMHAGDAVAAYRRTIDAQQQRFAAGETTLFESALTLDQLTSALLTEEQARLTWARLKLQIDLEQGLLVQRTAGGEFVPVRSGGRP